MIERLEGATDGKNSVGKMENALSIADDRSLLLDGGTSRNMRWRK